jgi:hypothetical protein
MNYLEVFLTFFSTKNVSGSGGFGRVVTARRANDVQSNYVVKLETTRSEGWSQERRFFGEVQQRGLPLDRVPICRLLSFGEVRIGSRLFQANVFPRFKCDLAHILSEVRTTCYDVFIRYDVYTCYDVFTCYKRCFHSHFIFNCFRSESTLRRESWSKYSQMFLQG